MSTLDFMLAGLAAAVASGETTLDDIVARLGNGDGASHANPATEYPTLTAHIATVTRALPKETRDTWNTHYRGLLEGTAEFGDYNCDACLDLEAG